MDAWLPVGDWVDVWTGERLSGAAAVTRPVPLDVVPVYARAQAWPELAIGTGRARRGERLAASSLIRQQAPSALAWAIRGRLASADAEPANPFDPLRRFEFAYPGLAERLDRTLAASVEEAARGLLTFARDVLEPGWSEFPSRAADLMAARFDWDMNHRVVN